MIKLRWNKKILNFEKVDWSGTDTQASRQITFTIPSNPYDKEFENAKIKLGDIVSLYDGSKRLFVGVVTARERTAEIGTASYTAKDFMHYLLRSNMSKVYKQTTPEKITRQVCKEAGVPCGTLANTGVTIKKLIFDDKPIYDIIARVYRKVTATTGKRYLLAMDGKKLTITEKGLSSGVTLEQGKDITGATYSDTTDEMVNLVKIYNDKKEQIGEVKKANLVTKYGVYQSTYTKEEDVSAKKEAKSMLTGIKKEASIEAIGNTAAVAGKNIIIHDKATGLSGTFYITSDEHTFSEGTHTMSLELAWYK